MDLKVGDFVQWNTSGGTARGQVSRIVREGTVAVPKSSFKIAAEPDDPAVLITLYRPNNNENGYMRQDVVVGHKMSTLKKIEPLTKEHNPMDEVEKRQYNTQQRRDMAERGEALPDGSFPIADKADLGNALQSIGRASNRALALAHIRKRAKDLDAMNMLPDWAMMKALEAGLNEADIIVLTDLRPHADATDDQWSLVIDEVAKAGGVRQTGGYAGEVLRKSAAAIAAAATAAQLGGKGGKSFGGNRSAAGRYAAEQRWARSRGQAAGAASGGGGASAGGGTPPKSPIEQNSTDGEWKPHIAARDEVMSDVPADVVRAFPAPLPKAQYGEVQGRGRTIGYEGAADFVGTYRNPRTTADDLQVGDFALVRTQTGGDRVQRVEVASIERTSKGAVIVTTPNGAKVAFHPKDNMNVRRKGADSRGEDTYDIWGRKEVFPDMVDRIRSERERWENRPAAWKPQSP